jgi:DNA-directed RNA polymerase subunit RPC12/RpoP
MADNDDSKQDTIRCPECRSTNIYLESTREHRAPRQGDEEPRVVAKTLNIRCRRCKADWSVLKRVTN